MSPETTRLSEQDERNYTSLMNLLGIFFGFIPSLVGYLVWKDQSEFLKRNLSSALNFHITMLIVEVAGTLILFFLPGLAILAVWVVTLVFSILAFVATREGTDYQYPLTIAFIK